MCTFYKRGSCNMKRNGNKSVTRMVSCIERGGRGGRASRLVSAGLRPPDQSEASAANIKGPLEGRGRESGNQEEIWAAASVVCSDARASDDS